MSRLSKALRRVKLGPAITALVKLAEQMFGVKTGEIKKKFVTEAANALIRAVEKTGLDIPENVEDMIEELIEQAVDLLFNQEKKQSAPVALTTTPLVGSVISENVVTKARRRRRTKAEMAAVRAAMPGIEFDEAELVSEDDLELID